MLKLTSVGKASLIILFLTRKWTSAQILKADIKGYPLTQFHKDSIMLRCFLGLKVRAHSCTIGIKCTCLSRDVLKTRHCTALHSAVL